MRGICPNCEREVELVLIHQAEKITIRGEDINIDVDYYKCTNCHAEFRDPQSLDDPLIVAYTKYRKIHGLLQPDEIKQFRNDYGLTQQELTNLLGWGGATLSRYENGALQDDAHDTLLRLVMVPSNLLELVRQKGSVLGRTKREKLLDRLEGLVSGKESFIPFFVSWFGSYTPSIYSGYKELNVAKLLNAILFFCKGEVPKTKLNKLLFYADFHHYKEYTVSITGAQYAHLPFGPAPDRYQYYLASLYHEEGAIEIREKDFGEYTGEYIRSLKEPDLSIFSGSELKVLATAKEKFERYTASQITKASHDEIGYKETRDGELISYHYAQSLKN